MRKQIPAGSQHNATRRDISRKLKRSLRIDREAWWTCKAEEMEKASATGNSRQLFRLIRETGSKRPIVSETIRDSNGLIICNQKQRLERWAEHFHAQFNWPSASRPLANNVVGISSWEVKLDAPSYNEVLSALKVLKRYRAARPDNLVPSLFKDGATLCSRLTELFRVIWDSENIPTN